jgi:hypothetical protein
MVSWRSNAIAFFKQKSKGGLVVRVEGAGPVKANAAGGVRVEGAGPVKANAAGGAQMRALAVLDEDHLPPRNELLRATSSCVQLRADQT